MNISVKEADNIKYNNILIDKLSISSISIDPLKRVANFTVSYWNGTVFLGNESYTYKATYITPLTQQLILKSISVPYTISYTITINAKIGTQEYNLSIPSSPFPYLTNNLTIYYSQTDASIISLTQDSQKPNITTASYSCGNLSNTINVFYTVGGVKYNVTILNSLNLPCTAGITTLYKKSNNSDISLTADSTFTIPLQIETLNVKSVPNPMKPVSNQTNIYTRYETTPIYKTIEILPTLQIYYNQGNISDIYATTTTNYIGVSASFTSVTFITGITYEFTNLSYITNTNITVTFQSKQLSVTDSSVFDSISTSIYYNPLNISDIGIKDDIDKGKYIKLINMLTSTTSTADINALTSLFKTLIPQIQTPGTLSI